MILLIDNYDSFTYNLYQYLCELQCKVEVKRNDEISLQAITQKKISKIVISPGPSRPENVPSTVALIKEMFRSKPILGVCLGHQCVGYAFGGSIVRAKKIMHGKVSKVKHDDSNLFKGIPNPFIAGRYHSLVIQKKTLPSSFAVSARSEDNEIMAIRHKRYPLFGIQFHPESILTPAGKQILKNFVDQHD